MAIIKYKFPTCQFWTKEEEIRFKIQNISLFSAKYL